MNDFFQLYANRNYEDAIKAIDFEIKTNEESLHPKSFQFLWYNKSFCLFKQSNFELALKEFFKIIDNDYSNSKDTFYMIAQCYLNLRNAEKAVEYCEKAIQSDGSVEIHIQILNFMSQCQSAKADKEMRDFDALINPKYQQEQSNPTTETTQHKQPTQTEQTQTQTQTTTQSTQTNAKLIEEKLNAAVDSGIQNASGDPKLDQQIALGYLLVNSNRLVDAIVFFTKLLQTHPKLVGAFIGRGTAFAFGGEFVRAKDDFTSALNLDSQSNEAFKRRAQVLNVLGLEKEAMSDLNSAVQINKNDSEALYQRGVLYWKQKNYLRSISDLTITTNVDKTHKLGFNYLGLCYTSIGFPMTALESFMQAVRIDPKFKEGWVNIGQAFKENGDYSKAIQYMTKSIEMDQNFAQGFFLRASTKFFAGNHASAFEDLTNALRLDPNHFEARQLRGVCAHGLGRFKIAESDYDLALQKKSDSYVFYLREIARFVSRNLDKSLKQINMDCAFDPFLKESFCKRSNPSVLKKYKQQPKIDAKVEDVKTPDSSSKISESVLKQVNKLGALLQLNAAGYLPNQRQHAMCGFSIIELAQKLKENWKTPIQLDGKNSSGNTQPHLFGWRDCFDIVIKWRQISEPNDPVWWVDLLTPQQFKEGFGSHTPMLTGQTKVVRYFPMFQKSFPIMKHLIPLQHPEFDESQIEKCENVSELYEIVKRDIWVVTPMKSIKNPKEVLEGTRLSLQIVEPEGFEYSIRTPGTPERWSQYDEEMTFVWNQIFELCSNFSKNGKQLELEKLSDLILSFVFLWFNFMPLSRGTAALGYIVMFALFLSVDISIEKQIPKDLQIDWEAILTSDVNDFIKNVSVWVYASRNKTKVSVSELPLISEQIPNLRSMINAMNTYVSMFAPKD